MQVTNLLLVVPRLNIGGAESYVFQLAKQLKAMDYNIYVASWGGLLANELKNMGITHYKVPIRLHKGLASMMLEKIIHRHNIQLVHANSEAAGQATALACMRANIPWVYTAHGRLNFMEQQSNIAQAQRIICVSDYLRNRFLSEGYLDPQKLITIYNGIDTATYSPTPENLSKGIHLREKWGVTRSDFLLGIVSRVARPNMKGHMDLLHLLATYENAKNWKLVIIGKGKYLPFLKYKAWRFGIYDRIIFAGHHTDMPVALSAIDVMAFPSKLETFGLAAAEAMSMGKPVVAYAVGGLPEVVDDGSTGFLVEKNGIKALYEKLLLVCNDLTLQKRISLNSREKIIQNFSYSQTTDKIADLYNAIVTNY
ncbi:glycosyltransferase family 4 protein [Pelosinus baikalensis]|uniref:Glycosyltransferase n=1 Tax=Pelosinus baikalensis TaxID=2892015 RepID=A0ABS8HLU3_9FIRM|nr:glycosyltransferase family 4 protein [Pelosinus baikalensis]MCC5464150.1 glycosyltransferase [Pelosinus baikalensis]